MADHEALDTGVDDRTVNLAEALLPLFDGQIVAAHDQMVVSFFHTVAREMLAAAGDVVLVSAFHIGQRIRDDFVGIISERAVVDDGVAPVVDHVRDWGEGPVHADRSSLFRRLVSHETRDFRAAGTHCRAGRQKHAALQGLLRTGFQVCSDEDRDLRMLLIIFVLIVLIFQGTALPADAAHMEALDNVLVGFLAVVIVHADEQLTDLLFQGHGINGILDPRELFFIQIKRFLSQIDHGILLF